MTFCCMQTSLGGHTHSIEQTEAKCILCDPGANPDLGIFWVGAYLVTEAVLHTYVKPVRFPGHFSESGVLLVRITTSFRDSFQEIP